MTTLLAAALAIALGFSGPWPWVIFVGAWIPLDVVLVLIAVRFPPRLEVDVAGP